jgi:hypothetical protein
MDISDLSREEQNALRSILLYWTEHWDWECPTLFGLQRDDFADVVAHWPYCLTQNQRVATLALVGATREFLHGASAVGKERVQEITGLTLEDAVALVEKVHKRSAIA